MRTKKTFLNLISEVIPQIIIAIISFIRVKVFLVAIGDEVLGVYQLFGQVLAYLSLAEFGLTDIVMYYLYKPIATKNNEKINSILSGVKKSFYIVMIIMLFIGVIIAPNVHFLIKSSSLTNSFIIIAFIMSLLVNILGYLSTPYMVMFNADQNKYKYSFYNQLLLVLKNIFDIIIILMFKNLIFVLIVEIIFTILQNIMIKILFKKNYSWVSFKSKPDMSFWKKTKSLIPHKIGGLVAYNIDVIIVSRCLGLVQVVTYNAYYTIINMISGIIGKISSASLASVGNLLVTEPKKSYKLFLEYNSLLFCIATVICVPLLVMFTPFVKIWYGLKYTVGFFAVCLFIFNLFYGTIRIILNVYSSAAALYKETLICTYLEIGINLLVSLLLISKLKIAGLLLGTALSMIISEFFLKPSILNKNIFKDSISKYYLDSIILFALFIANSILFIYIISFVTIKNLIIWFGIGILITILNTLLTLFEYKLLHKNEFLNRFKFLFKKTAQ